MLNVKNTLILLKNIARLMSISMAVLIILSVLIRIIEIEKFNFVYFQIYLNVLAFMQLLMLGLILWAIYRIKKLTKNNKLEKEHQKIHNIKRDYFLLGQKTTLLISTLETIVGLGLTGVFFMWDIDSLFVENQSWDIWTKLIYFIFGFGFFALAMAVFMWAMFSKMGEFPLCHDRVENDTVENIVKDIDQTNKTK